MAREAKLLAQETLSNTITPIYTTPSGNPGATQVVCIWIANTGEFARKVEIYGHGDQPANLLIPEVSLAEKSAEVLDDLKITLAPSDYIAMKQNDGTDVVVTLYGIEVTT